MNRSESLSQQLFKLRIICICSYNITDRTDTFLIKTVAKTFLAPRLENKKMSSKAANINKMEIKTILMIVRISEQ